MIDGEAAAEGRMELLEARIKGAAPQLPSEFWKLRSEVLTILQQGALEGLLKPSFRDLKPLLKISKNPDDYGIASIAGGDRHEFWVGSNQVERDDHARFNFVFQVGYPARLATRTAPEIIAYHLNLAFPNSQTPTFVRFDLNEAAFAVTGTRSAARSPLLCHVHPGHGHKTMPSPILSPQEVLDLVIRGHLR